MRGKFKEFMTPRRALVVSIDYFAFNWLVIQVLHAVHSHKLCIFIIAFALVLISLTPVPRGLVLYMR